MDERKQEYFEWMYNLVVKDLYINDYSYRKLLLRLHSIKFTYKIRKDQSRAKDGVALRERFGIKYDDPCSVLEMMVALALRIEETLMDNPAYGDRTAQWFWRMIVNLGLGSMYDGRYNEEYVNKTVTRFLKREFEPDGNGGLFTVRNSGRDLRTVEIWVSMLWYLNSVGKI